ncbi:hypothetical protein [Chitinophaga caseinilytica]|uniref:hypothetical protein n=1 Tax=Chitinophaga caseinilytica TaxID=2267521 RepID=UPI003C2B541C
MPNRYLSCAWMLLLLASCGRTPETYVKFVNDPANGLTLQRNVGDVWYRAQLLPADYQILLSRSGDAGIGNVERDSLRAMYGSYYYVRFEVGSTQAEDGASELNLHYDATGNFMLVMGGDSLSAAFCQPIAGGRKGAVEYMMAFPKEKPRSENITLVYNNPAWNNPIQQFTFSDKNFDVTLF